jgi:putative nucleotidyltransferase with HDIG domain
MTDATANAGSKSPLDRDGLQRFRAEVLGRKNLPTIPAMLGQILRLVEREDTSAKELVTLIEHDQALTGKMLRLANSAFFGQARRVATIPRAVMLLGFSTVRNLALGVKVWDTLAGGLNPRRLEELWGHAVMVAIGSKALTAKLCAGDPDEAFTAGLLHDVGRVVIAGRFGDAYWKTLAEAPATQSADTVEQATFGVDHTEVGGWLLEAWGLPPAIVEAARLHHAALERSGRGALVAVANQLAARTDMKTGELRDMTPAFLAAIAERGVTPELCQAVVAALRADESLSALGRPNA